MTPSIARPSGTAPFYAALWMMGAVTAFTSMAVAGRAVSIELDTFEIMAWRSLIGMAIVVIFGIGIIVFWTGEEVVTAPGTEDEVIVDEGTAIEGDDTATVPVAPD